jgi:hypothetical protein
MKCEKCGKEHDGSYGSGRFCSAICARSYSTANETRSTKIVQCIDCGRDIEVDKRASNKQCKCDDCRKHNKYPVNKNLEYCINCGAKLTREQKMYCSKECQDICKKDDRTILTRKKRRRRKELLTSLFHNRCFICGIEDDPCVYDFHHIKHKDFTISSGNNKSLKKQLIELKECIMVCSNCHRKIHNNFVDITLDNMHLDTKNIDDLLLMIQR